MDYFWECFHYHYDLESALNAVNRWQDVLIRHGNVYMPDLPLEMAIELLEGVGAPFVHTIAQSLLAKGCLQVPDLPEINPVPDYLSKLDLSNIV